MNTRGFTLIELMVTVVLIGILLNLAVPGLQELKHRAQTAAVIADVKVIETALLDYFATHGEMPRNAAMGVVPSGLSSSLPDGFNFDTGTVRYRWPRWGRRRQQREGEIGIIKIRSRDRDLMRSVKGLYQGRTTGTGRPLADRNRRTTYARPRADTLEPPPSSLRPPRSL